MKYYLKLVFILVLLVQFSHALENKKIDVKIGVLAKRGIAKALDKWEPTAKYLNDYYSQYNFKIVPMGFDEIPLLVSNSLVDFVIVNSGIYINLAVKYNINRIATLKNHLKSNTDVTKFGSVIFAKNSSSINTLNQINNKNIAAVHETSFGGWIMAKREILDANIDIKSFKKLVFLNTHDNVVKSVLNDESDVGIVRTDTLERMASEKRIDISKIKVLNKKEYKDFPFLSSSRLYPEWPIAKLEHTSSKVAKDVALALMNMSSDSFAAKVSKIDGWTIPENYNSVDDILKTLHLSPYETYGQINIQSVVLQYWKSIVLFSILLLSLLFVIYYIFKLNKKLESERFRLAKNEEQFRSTFEQSGIGIVYINFEGYFIRINQQFCKIVKSSSIEIEKLNFSDFIYPEDLAKVTKAISILKNSIENKIELKIRLNSNSEDIIWIVITLSKIVQNDDDNYIVATILDISDIKKLESKIKLEKHQKDIILNIAGDGILGLDKDAKHTFVNVTAAKLLGYEVEEMIGKDSHAMWHHTYPNGDVFPSLECPITAVLNNGITHRGHNEVFWKKDQTTLKVNFISTPIKEDDKVIGSVVIFSESDPLLGRIE